MGFLIVGHVNVTCLEMEREKFQMFWLKGAGYIRLAGSHSPKHFGPGPGFPLKDRIPKPATIVTCIFFWWGGPYRSSSRIYPKAHSNYILYINLKPLTCRFA